MALESTRTFALAYCIPYEVKLQDFGRPPGSSWSSHLNNVCVKCRSIMVKRNGDWFLQKFLNFWSQKWLTSKTKVFAHKKGDKYLPRDSVGNIPREIYSAWLQFEWKAPGCLKLERYLIPWPSIQIRLVLAPDPISTQQGSAVKPW